MDNHIAKNHAYAITMAVNTMVTAMGMMAENQQRIHRGESLAYTEENFQKLINDNGCHHNAVLSINWDW
jgi:hypothetical protein